ncbi:hypothetical protein HAX54_026588, partial [Datura stramonium]|nr:hypothetical protein [Datura stramonium]
KPNQTWIYIRVKNKIIGGIGRGLVVSLVGCRVGFRLESGAVLGGSRWVWVFQRLVVTREMKKKEGKKGVKRLPAVICHRKIWGEGREGDPVMREKRESAAACCFSGVGDGGEKR